MKKLFSKKGFLFVGLFSIIVLGCQDEQPTLEGVVVPSNLRIDFNVLGTDAENPNGDGSGIVEITATADHAVSYKIIAGIDEVSNSSGTYTYDKGFQLSDQLNTLSVTVIAYGQGGISTTGNDQTEVYYSYQPPAELLEKLYGDESRTWRIKSEQNGHFGLGPVGGQIPAEWYGASAGEKIGTGMYDDRYVFNANGTMTHITDINSADESGTVFGRIDLINELDGQQDAEIQGADVLNYPLDDYTANWTITGSGDITNLNLTGTGFIGYYIGGTHTYQIFDSTVPNELLIKSTDGNNEFDWWFIITSEEEEVVELPILETQYSTLVWADEFDTDGPPNPNNWVYDLGDGCPNLCGWGNGEAQVYTSNAENVVVENDNLVITAINTGFGYTSARIKSKGLQEFMYGRVEVRAKLPTGGGTWPAIWMLGADIDTNPWPGSGEIDIMEHVGNQQNVIFGSTHDPINNGGNARTGSIFVPGVSDEFHVYQIEWDANQIQFVIDGEVYHSVTNSPDRPFNKDFFFLMNIAMGGSFGGNISSTFESSTLEVDYIRMYQ